MPKTFRISMGFQGRVILSIPLDVIASNLMDFILESPTRAELFKRREEAEGYIQGVMSEHLKEAFAQTCREAELHGLYTLDPKDDSLLVQASSNDGD